MSAPVIWIILPFLLSVAFLFMDKRPRLVKGLAIATGGLLGLFAFFQPIGGLLQLGPISIEIKESLAFFGRAFVLHNSDRFLLGLIFIAYAVFIAAKDSVGLEPKFTSLGLSFISLLIAAVSVEPFLYAAILIELAILVAIPLANKKGSNDDKNLLYFLIYASLAMPFILLAGWILGGIQANPSDEANLSKAAILLGIGFSLWLGVFPFHSWVARFTGTVHPLVSGLLLSLLPTVMLFIMIDFIFGLTWLRDSEALPQVFRVIGIVMTVTAGAYIAVEKDIKRLFGLIVLFETGAALLLLSVSGAQNLQLFYLSFLPRIAGLALLSYCLSVLEFFKETLTLDGLKGVLKRYPFASTGLILAILSVIGFPLLGSFPIKVEILLSLGSLSTGGLIWYILGMIGYLFGTFRLILHLSHPSELVWKINEKLSQMVIITFGILILLFLGLFPGTMSKIFSGLLSTIPGLM